VKQKH